MPNKNFSRRITVAEMAPHIHHFGIKENKVNKLSAWLKDWILKKLKSGEIKPYDMLPLKGDLACHIGVSLGTMQNVFREVEDSGLIESKQRIGAYIKNPKEPCQSPKLTSKREIAIEFVKTYLANGNYQPGEYLISCRKLSKELNISNATIRLALDHLVLEGVLEKSNKMYIIKRIDFELQTLTKKSLVEKISESLEEYIKENYSEGDKIPNNTELSNLFNVSIKTIHDSIKLLTKEGLLYAKRGQYGTIVANSATKNELYSYEKVELKIKNYIFNNCEIGAKLPSILEFAQEFSVSPKTIKKALDCLAEDGYLTFSRGRYGGTFVTDIPQVGNEAYKWLALSSDYIPNT